MKNYFTLLLLFIAITESFPNTFYNQLCAFNPNWEKYALQAPEGKAQSFNSDKEYVQAHLNSVIPILRTATLDEYQSTHYQSRMHLIELLERYSARGIFPVNYHFEKRIPVFIDKNNTHCAVGYLLKETGYGNLAKEIAHSNKYSWLKDIHNSALSKWQKTSGFSIEELKLIQGAYEYYIPNALMLANKYEVPQKPECMILYFDNGKGKQSRKKEKENIWCYGEGENGVLNGVWEQNFSKGIPWIKGYYKNGKRTGQWKEYYQGTNQLCRTENWRDDQLNGIRKRFNRAGVLIEEILFKNGVAISKINYDLTESLKWIRKPLDSNSMQTKVYTFGGALIAEGQEKVHNPGNLLWFQNIELTALNSASITSKSRSVSPHSRSNLFSSIPLVEYKKEGRWIYYQDIAQYQTIEQSPLTLKNMLHHCYAHFGDALFESIKVFEALNITSEYDSIQVVYSDNQVQHFYGHGEMDYVHLNICYHKQNIQFILNQNLRVPHSITAHRIVEAKPRIKEFGQYNEAHQKIGVWKHFDEFERLYKTENYILPWKEEEEVMTY